MQPNDLQSGRRFEVVEAARKKNRLTVTPSRITLKILPQDIDKRDMLIDTAKRIAAQIEYSYSLRGAFDMDEQIIILSSGKIRRPGYWKNRNTFTFTFAGVLLGKEFNKDPAKAAQQRFAHLRNEIRNNRISHSEIAELRSLAEYIDPSDVELLEWAAVPENGYQCGSCEQTFDRLSAKRECPHCGSGNWVEGLIDEQKGTQT